MTEEGSGLVRRELRSPRAAAIAGIGYSLLTIASMVLTAGAARIRPENMTLEWLDTWSGAASLVLTMVVFAAIAFLWFTGVIRDRLRDREDRFFSTIFQGSGIIVVALSLVWAAILWALLRLRAAENQGLIADISPDVYIFGFVVLNEIAGNLILRMSGLYMTAIATLWSKTGHMPRWFALITYGLAVGFMVAAPRIRDARFIFPGWVFAVSAYVLFVNYRPISNQVREHDRSTGA